MELSSVGGKRILFAIDLIALALFLLSIWLMVLTIAGYGTLKLNVPPSVTVHINGHLTTTRTLKLRPGAYSISLASSTIMPTTSTARVSLFHTTIFNSTASNRSPDAIASSLLAGLNIGGPLAFSETITFDSGAWLVGTLGIPTQPTLVLNYDHTKSAWSVAYFQGQLNPYPHDLTRLPPDVTAYVKTLEANHVPLSG